MQYGMSRPFEKLIEIWLDIFTKIEVLELRKLKYTNKILIIFYFLSHCTLKKVAHSCCYPMQCQSQ